MELTVLMQHSLSLGQLLLVSHILFSLWKWGFNPGEVCDDSNYVSNDGCSDTCQTEAGYSCPVFGQNCSPVCGDGMTLANEACDDGSDDNIGCSTGCVGSAVGWTCSHQ